MKFFKSFALLCLSLIFIGGTVFALQGCGSKDYSKIELNEVTHSIFYAPLYVAINNGYFEDEGLTVTLTNGGGSDTSMSALLTGSADIILAGPETVVYTSQEGVSNAPVVFGQLTTCDGSFIVSKENETDFTLADLVGETIIGGRAGGLPAMTLQYVIENAGYTIGTGDSEVNLRTDVAFNLTASVWEGDSSVKYCTLFEPTATNVENEGKGYVVSSVGEISGSIPYTCFIARSSYLSEHSDIAEKFLSAVMRAYEYIQTASVSDVAASLLPSFDGNTLADMEAAVQSYKAIGAWSSDMILTEESFSNLMTVMLNAGVITETSEWSSCVNNSIAESLSA